MIITLIFIKCRINPLDVVFLALIASPNIRLNPQDLARLMNFVLFREIEISNIYNAKASKHLPING
jgi:hypothetical protein